MCITPSRPAPAPAPAAAPAPAPAPAAAAARDNTIVSGGSEKKRNKAKGRRATVLTGSRGDLGTANIGKALLGE